MEKIVLTGGPSGGKSTAFRHLENVMGNYVCLVPEVATILLSGGFPAPDLEHSWSPEWQSSFQLAVAIGQIAIEDISEQRGIKNSKSIMICDRGLADGSAYLPKGIDDLCIITGQNPSLILDRYEQVIHLTTSAKQSNGYKKHTNKHRFEEANEAIELDDKIMEAWNHHPNRIVLNIEDTEERNKTIENIIREHIHNNMMD